MRGFAARPTLQKDQHRQVVPLAARCRDLARKQGDRLALSANLVQRHGAGVVADGKSGDVVKAHGRLQNSAHARVKRGIDQIDDDIADHDEQAPQQHNADDDGTVLIAHRLHRQRSDAL